MARKPYIESYTDGSFSVDFKQELIPTGTITMTQNGNYNVEPYASAVVNVEGGGITPTGTKNITENGLVDVTTYANANVNVPQGVFPSGAKEITENGTYDVTNFASAIVNIQSGGGSGQMTTGSFTPLDTAEPQLIEHGLGGVPTYFYFVSALNSSAAALKGGYIFPQGVFEIPGYDYNKVRFTTQYNSWRAGDINTGIFTDIDEDFIEITPDNDTPFISGYVYYWVAIKI